MNHMFVLMDEVKELITRLQSHNTEHVHTAISVLNGRIDEIRNRLEKPDSSLEEEIHDNHYN